ncbi:unnamed protein product [Brachionus calyciflorus]|uniref:GAS2-like protein 1 n=1 Tax=Brachionus calyciflorus TaxID=104777 RepID=A0A813MCQ1_9BILA|nr:unnamed protein product [Brachionus calyciflorus]
MSEQLENSRVTEMKSIQPYSTKDEYIYAMKEDLSEWFNSMYSTNLTAPNFTDKLETGVLICLHANNVTRAALNTHKFNQNDLNQAGIINIPTDSIINPSSNNRVLLTPSGKTSWSGDFLLYKPDAKPQSFQSRDNISNFIKWCRFIAKVRECLMFETDDLILRKNEKNFILCLLEVARFGSKFGIQVPTIIQLEQEIEAEIERENSNLIDPIVIRVLSPKPEVLNKEINIYVEDEKLSNNKNDIQMILSKISDDLANQKSELSKKLSRTDSVVISVTNESDDKKLNSNGSFDSSSLDGSFGVDEDDDWNNLDETKKSVYNDSLENLNYIDEKERQNRQSCLPERECKNIDSDSRVSIQSFSNINNDNNKLSEDNSPLLPSPLSTSLSSSNSSLFNQNEEIKNNNLVQSNSKIVKNLNNLFNGLCVNEKTEKILSENLEIKVSSVNRSRSVSGERLEDSEGLCSNMVKSCVDKMTYSLEQNGLKQELLNSQNNLHNHVCSIADRCTCEKQFPVVKIGEGKYRIGNTKNVVFIRILRNHIMVRVGGGWDTLENYLNKHDPCRCPGEASHSNLGIKTRHNENNLTNNEPTPCLSNILLTPVTNQNSTNCQANSVNKIHSSLSQNPFIKYQTKISTINKNCSSTNCSTNTNLKTGIDFTDAKLVVERDTQGKHIVGKIIITQKQDDSNHTNISLNKSISNNSLNNYSFNNTTKIFNASMNIEMNGLNNNNNNKNILQTPIKQNQNNSFSLSKQNFTKPCIPTSNSLNSISQNLLKNKMKKIIKQIPPQSPQIVRKSQNIMNENQFVLLRNSPGLLKFNRTNVEICSNATTTGYNSLNDDSSSDFLDSTPIYTETKLPPRILKKYDCKKRAITEAIIDIDNMEHNQAIPKLNENIKVTSSSPKPPPRNKKKYRKSKTTDIARFNNSDSQINEDSLESELNDSLESINLTLNKDNKIDDDSLLLNNDHGISLSLSTTSSISNINEIDDLVYKNGQKLARAQWDKTQLNFDYKTEMNNSMIQSSKLINTSSPKRDSSLSKKARNLNIAKEKLVEMKKSIDAKINLEQVEKPKILTPNSPLRTTPRKVKKRSGERSVTTGIVQIPLTPKTKPFVSLIPKPSPVKLTPNSKQTSSSLHNLTNCLENRNKRDSSVASSRTSTNHNVSFSSINTTPIEFKENKAYELRKKTMLMNKISVKNQLNDPIYSRSHPISTELAEQQALNLTNDSIQSCLSNETTVRKRLFAKKNEKNFDPNLSIGSNCSSNSTNFIQKNKILAMSPMKAKKPNLEKKESPVIKTKPPSRSKSNNDLFYELERTNSAQDLIELMNNCEPPVGDLNKYKILLNECENLDSKMKRSKKMPSPKKCAKLSVNLDEQKKAKNSQLVVPQRQNSHKRSRSLPSYQCIPLNNNNINNKNLDYDTGNEEEYHEETYWQDIKTNF